MRGYRVKSLDELKKLLGTNKDLRIYPLGDALLIADSEDKARQAMEAISLPPHLSYKVLKKLWLREPAVVIKENKTCLKIIIADIASGDIALLLANRLASQLAQYSPFIVRRVDCILSYRSSEDGGFTIKNTVEVVIAKGSQKRVVEEVLSLIRRSLKELTKVREMYSSSERS